jgi:hypothetical protein
MRFAIFAVMFFAGLSAAHAGEGTNQVVVTNRLLNVTNKMSAGTNAIVRGQLVVQTIDEQIADLQTEIHDVQARRLPLEKAQAQRHDLGLPADPGLDGNLSKLNGDMSYLTNQLQMWRQERVVFLQTRGISPHGPRPVPPPPSPSQ